MIQRTINLETIETYLDRGLCSGVGNADSQVCVEAAICLSLGLPLGDDPPCTAPALRSYNIALNDAPWSSPGARSAGMRPLLLAQIGTRSRLDANAFLTRLAELTIRRVLPPMLRAIGLPAEAERCEQEGTAEAAAAAAAAAEAAAAEAAAAKEAAWAAAAGGG